jgi:hypothetical protein
VHIYSTTYECATTFVIAAQNLVHRTVQRYHYHILNLYYVSVKYVSQTHKTAASNDNVYLTVLQGVFVIKNCMKGKTYYFCILYKQNSQSSTEYLVKVSNFCFPLRCSCMYVCVYDSTAQEPA